MPEAQTERGQAAFWVESKACFLIRYILESKVFFGFYASQENEAQGNNFLSTVDRFLYSFPTPLPAPLQNKAHQRLPGLWLRGTGTITGD